MFNRLKYDPCAAKTVLSDNISIFDHTMDVSRHLHGSPCMTQGLTGGNTASVSGPLPTPDNVSKSRSMMVAIENDLRGQTRDRTRCPDYEYRGPGPDGLVHPRHLYKESDDAPVDVLNLTHLSYCPIAGGAGPGGA